MVPVSYTHLNTRNGEMVALNGVTLDIHDNEFICVVGPSGCGKSTLLNIIADGELERPPSTPRTRTTTFALPPKKAIAPGAALAPLDINQEGLPLREARNQKRKAISPTP